MKLRLAISPCPNDTFSFWALLHGHTSWPPEWQVQFDDIQALNLLALEGTPDVVKISAGLLPEVEEQYQVLDSGAALGNGVGPLLVAYRHWERDELPRARIAVPGQHTTAHLLLQFFAPDALQREQMPFDRIMPAIAKRDVDAGVIIHESRFTYAEHDLVCLADLGQHWEEKTGLPVPLGCIVAKRSLGGDVIARIDQALQESIRLAYARANEAMPFVRQHAQEMSELVMRKHIELYVNHFSFSLGELGHKALDHMRQLRQQLVAAP